MRLILALAACDDDAPPPDAPTFDLPDTAAVPVSWTQLPETPCANVRAAVVEDEGQTVWLACDDLLWSDDGAQRWSTATLDLQAAALHRSDDGLLYVGGGGVVAIDTDDLSLGIVLPAEDPALDGRVVAFRRTGGLSVALVHAGFVGPATSVVARFDDADTFAPVDLGGPGLYALAASDGRIYGAGETADRAPAVFLPAAYGHDEAEGLTWIEVPLHDGVGALEAIHVDEDGVVAAGWAGDDGLVFVSGRDPYLDPWVEHALAGTRFLGACRQGSVIAAVGERPFDHGPVAVRSEDGAATWVDITPEHRSALKACHVDAGGAVTVLGDDGWAGIWSP